ncbi:ribosomal protein S30A [Irineochytrium annulatum]|nr:ribosomal protein S30A [Irineochytrium annulatum]
MEGFHYTRILVCQQARAGKVKGQTPKVEKQEKKKQPKGRAKKRLQYNRRFVNAVATFGKRRMNPNPTDGK